MQYGGSSGSCYSIRHFLDVDPRLLDSEGCFEKDPKLEQLLSSMKYISDEGVGHDSEIFM